MCGRYGLVINMRALMAKFGVSQDVISISKEGDKWQPKFQHRTEPTNPVVIADEHAGDGQLVLM
jgi:hypothetical protein